MTRLVEAGLVDADWNKARRTKGLVTTSVVSFIVRKGNPKDIQTWDDLLKPGVKVLTPNPFTSGAAKWNLLAAYGARSTAARTRRRASTTSSKLINDHVKVQDKSGREALQNFTSGNGDVLLSYEYEATTAQKKGEDVDYVIPDDTIKIDITIADDRRTRPSRRKAFLDYVLSEPGAGRSSPTGATARSTRRCSRPTTTKFPTPRGLFTIDDLGGWTKVNDELFDPEKGSIAKIEEDAGVSTAK